MAAMLPPSPSTPRELVLIEQHRQAQSATRRILADLKGQVQLCALNATQSDESDRKLDQYPAVFAHGHGFGLFLLSLPSWNPYSLRCEGIPMFQTKNLTNMNLSCPRFQSSETKTLAYQCTKCPIDVESGPPSLLHFPIFPIGVTANGDVGARTTVHCVRTRLH